MKQAEQFENALIKMFVDLIGTADISHSEFGRRVFGNASGARIWRFMRMPERTRSLSVVEAYKGAEVLGLDFPFVAYQVAQTLKTTDTES